jgi:site-specific recombinase XerD
LLGHVSVSTTQVYLRVTTEQKRRAIEDAYPSLSPAPTPAWR